MYWYYLTPVASAILRPAYIPVRGGGSISVRSILTGTYPLFGYGARRGGWVSNVCSNPGTTRTQEGLRTTMPLTKDAIADLSSTHGRHEGDTGSPEVQVAMLTRRISELTQHLKIHIHDEHSRRGLLKMVGARLRHLKYLAKKNPAAYKALIEKLGLRDYVRR